MLRKKIGFITAYSQFYVMHMIVELQTLMLNVSVTNPCANHSCSEMCVLSAGGSPACLCSDGTVVEKGEACPSKVTGHFALEMM
jgi:hypothetical protein